MIVHKTATSFLLCYVDHHDKAYKWAERQLKCIKTGALGGRGAQTLKKSWFALVVAVAPDGVKANAPKPVGVQGKLLFDRPH